ncbi:protein of unknown function [Petrocella atlantisensis]|uniref:Uncharacterized protein n=1 Tax=Petrocella atlantisensis TaxID=2173034 RepID=A0A3P7PQH6_9FIRM|nr:protein of unknown function [Petrocella atlantisensis]
MNLKRDLKGGCSREKIISCIIGAIYDGGRGWMWARRGSGSGES